MSITRTNSEVGSLLVAGITAMSNRQIASVAAFEQQVLRCPQVHIHTHHVLHAGMYSRTILIPADCVLTGALVKVATQLVISGDVMVSRGDVETRVTGYAVLPASAGRKQAFLTFQDTTLTMVFTTSATTVEQAEAEFTDEANMLFSRLHPERNTEVITGE